MDWFQFGKGVHQGCILNFAYLTSMQSTSREILAGLDEVQAGIKIAGRNINNLRYADNHSNGRNCRGTKEPLDKGEEEIGVFMEFSCFFHDPTDVDNLMSGSSPFSKSNLNIWKFSVHVK